MRREAAIMQDESESDEEDLFYNPVPSNQAKPINLEAAVVRGVNVYFLVKFTD